jgi:hypothetical protein
VARFDRVYSSVIGPGGGQGVEITRLRVSFKVTKDDSKNPNRGTISVYNLAPATRAAIERPDVRCVLRAGYAEEGGPVEMFQGDVVYAFTTYKLADVITQIELAEGAKAVRDTTVSFGYPAGVSSTTALRDVAAKMGLALSMPDDAPSRTWQNGLSFHGAAHAALDRITRGAGLSWSIQGGAIQIIRGGGNTNRTVVELAADSGLLVSPERERKAASELSTDPKVQERIAKREAEERAEGRVVSGSREFEGWRTRSLLLPSLVPGDRVKLSARAASGVLTIKEITHTGDTHGGDWVSEMLLVDTTPSASDRRAQAPAPRTQVRQSNPGGALPLPPTPPAVEPPRP